MSDDIPGDAPRPEPAPAPNTELDEAALQALAAGTGNPPLVRVFDGATGEERPDFFAFDPNFSGTGGVQTG
ncbi:hypothetical protein [Pseudoroseomonas cervicalis]|uniref:hypothetical protein n=1 Tax=Teichococcus cervicalis TaxID=204525 RepID=UPI002781A6CC|nr:hypothetical protein [Pseudoroseomonas cervicalis]MDQ1080336.1 hypothetical protein [Pseudoroseomonas cervicalis]